MSESTGPATSNVYQTCDPDYLRQLRERAAMDISALAKTACMSVAQVRELEQGTDTGVFYSDSIRRQSYKRLLMILGAEPPREAPVAVPLVERQEHQTQLHNLDQIAAMSRQPTIIQSPWAPVLRLLGKVFEHKQTVGAGVFLAVAAGLLIWIWPQEGSEPVLAHVTQAASEAGASASTSAAEVAAAVSKNVTKVEAPTAAAVPASAPAPVKVAVTPATAPAASAVTTLASKLPAQCAYSSDALPQLTSISASKPGRYVYFVSTANVELCVVDASKQVTILTLKAGESRSVYGASPWQVSSASLDKVQVFFQGWRVVLPSDSTKRISLVEKPVTP